MRPRWLDPDLEARARAFFEANPGAGWREVRRALGLARPGHAQALVEYFRELGVAQERATKGQAERAQPLRLEMGPEGGLAEGVVEGRIRGLRDVESWLRERGVDLRGWEVERWVVNEWEMGAKSATGELVSRPLSQVKVWLRRATFDPKEVRSALEAVFGDFFQSPPPEPPKRPPVPRYAVLAVPDLHVGKLAWWRETGENYDTEIALGLWREATRDLLGKLAALGGAEELVVPLGNDLFHVDSLENTTTRGTRVDVDSRWQKAFVLVRDFVLEEVIEPARREAGRVRVVVVPGNHDHQRAYYLGVLLEAVYRGARDVVVDATPRPRKYLRLGKNLFGWTHGHRERPQQLPSLMALEARLEWGLSTYREWQLGHYHRQREGSFWPLTEEGGVVIRVLPSLSAADAWHAEMGFVGQVRAAQLLLYGEEGIQGTFFWRPKHVGV